jgi:hypothetical protein
MYHTGLDPFTLQPIFVEKDLRKKEFQKQILINKAKSLLLQKKQESRMEGHKSRKYKQVLGSHNQSKK